MSDINISKDKVLLTSLLTDEDHRMRYGISEALRRGYGGGARPPSGGLGGWSPRDKLLSLTLSVTR
ncbi:MAG: hypothetical protein RIG27_00180, partial [Coleofasciculus sp. F4-SAH-05]